MQPASTFFLNSISLTHLLTTGSLVPHHSNAAPFCQPDYIQAAKRRKWRRRRRRRRKLKPVCSFLRSFSIHSFAAIHSRSTNPKKCQQQETGRATSKAREAARTRSDRSLGLGRIWKRRTLNGYGTAMCVCVCRKEKSKENPVDETTSNAMTVCVWEASRMSVSMFSMPVLYFVRLKQPLAGFREQYLVIHLLHPLAIINYNAFVNWKRFSLRYNF